MRNLLVEAQELKLQSDHIIKLQNKVNDIDKWKDEVQSLFFRQFDARSKRHDTCLFTLRVDYSNLSGVDFFITPYALCSCDTQILQKLN